MVTGWPNMSNPADDTFFFILGISLTLLALNTGVMIYFVFRYSRKRHPQAEEVKENTPIEIIWTVIPTLLVLAIFYVGWKGFVYMRTAPPDAMPVKVTARQWSWTFDYANGKETNVLKVPVEKPVKLLITSADVLHSLFIPAYSPATVSTVHELGIASDTSAHAGWAPLAARSPSDSASAKRSICASGRG